MAAALGLVYRAKPEMKQRIHSAVTPQVDRTAVTTVASRRATSGNELLTPEGNTAVPSTSSPDMQDGFIDESQNV